MRRVIAVAAVCLVVGGAGGARARAQESAASVESADDARADVELALSLSPSFLLALGAMQLGGAGGGLGGLGGLGAISSGALGPTLDVGFALDRSTYFVVGVSGVYSERPTEAYMLSVPLSVLWYLEPPRVGHVMPMLRVGVGLSYGHTDYAGQTFDSIALGASARGGITWLADRALGLRAEVGLRGGVSDNWGATPGSVGGSIGLDALVSVVLRV